MPQLTPEQIRMYMESLGLSDFQQGAVPSGFTNQGVVDPNAVYTPGGEYMGQYEMMPQMPSPGLLNQGVVSNIEANMMNSGNQPVNTEQLTSQFNLDRLLKQLQNYR